jgi:tetratricopeptide (TPR) repeat protein
MSRLTEPTPRARSFGSAAAFATLLLVSSHAAARVPPRSTPAFSKGVPSRTAAATTKGTPAPTPGSDAARDEAAAAFKLGTKLVSETKWGEALAAFERAQARVPHAITLFNVGVCERALGRYTAARRTFKAALTEDSERRTTLPQQLRMDATG